METRKRSKKGQVAPGSESDGGKENEAFQLGLTDYSKKNGGSAWPSVAKELAHQEGDGFNLLLNVKATAAKWKTYTGTRRNKKKNTNSAQDVATIEGAPTMAKTGGGIGLDDIHEEFSNPMSSRQKETTVDPKMRVASNRAFIQYFAKLGQSMVDEEVINLEFVHTLVSSGADINCMDTHGQTVLHEVARCWHVDVAKFLIEHGAEVNQADNYGRMPLHVAAAVDYPEMCNLLIEHGADKEARTKGELQTPVFFAAKNDAIGSLKALIKAGCKFMKEIDYKGRTPIHVAAELDRSETARVMLDLNAPVWIADNEGIRAITWMINKMPPVANEALNQFHLTDRPNRKQYFYLNFLIRDKAKDPNGLAQTPLHCVTQYKQYDLIMHEVFIQLCEVMWQRFGRFWALWNLGLNFMYIIMWTIIGVSVEYDKRYQYKLPEDIWRMVLWIVAVLLTVYQIVEEIRDFLRSAAMHEEFEKKRIEEIEKDLEFAHPRWPGESKYLREEIDAIIDLKPKYFSDMWNIFDWMCYGLLSVCILTHVIDVANHSELASRLHIRFMSVTIILLWLRLMKNARAFALLGPFIVMLGHMLNDIFKFMFLYLEFFIPFLCAFWMMFGGEKKDENDHSVVVSVSGFRYFGQAFYTMFRMTLVDEYDFDNMMLIDNVMAQLLLFAWFFLSAILCLNLFIALLSDTFVRVYDNAQANAVMQKALTIISIWEGINRKRKDNFWKYIEDNCSPLMEMYDDDMTVAGDDDVKKVTIQIKEDLDDFQEMFKLHFGDPRHAQYSSAGSLESGGAKAGSMVSKAQFELEMSTIKENVESVRSHQEAMSVRMKKDMSSVKSMLKQLLEKPGDPSGSYYVDTPSYLSEGSTPVAKLKKKKKNKSPGPATASAAPRLDIDNTEFSPAGNFVDPNDPIIDPTMSSLAFSPAEDVPVLGGLGEYNSSNTTDLDLFVLPAPMAQDGTPLYQDFRYSPSS